MHACRVLVLFSVRHIDFDESRLMQRACAYRASIRFSARVAHEISRFAIYLHCDLFNCFLFFFLHATCYNNSQDGFINNKFERRDSIN